MTGFDSGHPQAAYIQLVHLDVVFNGKPSHQPPSLDGPLSDLGTESCDPLRVTPLTMGVGAAVLLSGIARLRESFFRAGLLQPPRCDQTSGQISVGLLVQASSDSRTPTALRSHRSAASRRISRSVRSPGSKRKTTA